MRGISAELATGAKVYAWCHLPGDVEESRFGFCVALTCVFGEWVAIYSLLRCYRLSNLHHHLGLDTYLRIPALSMLTVIIVPTVDAWRTYMTGDLAYLRK